MGSGDRPFIADAADRRVFAAIVERDGDAGFVAHQAAFQQEAGEQQAMPLHIGGGLGQPADVVGAVLGDVIAQRAGVGAQLLAFLATGFEMRGEFRGVHAEPAQCRGGAGFRRLPRGFDGRFQAATKVAGEVGHGRNSLVASCFPSHKEKKLDGV